ncbi:uncharacterized protein LOC110984686 [Acanthaster planci]|uniref:Uncharacterized protein LOC110984686 n=1 Tax=Acanthaster planci TaxID=133434 RepID=A0A8B7ZC64_ACAPL|nr:uncharacterized protein LOC110984686 [Acanthaster planci]XP_022100796.1 uncharacterized protein LOC110984686 [Acanthaster planci]XP_022100797.1 uncharacterized protein LOC110984686 [Acanthaster planci]XP_022100798.1 uncharacterized protein LOC110984686 [Acanthaster planci]
MSSAGQTGQITLQAGLQPMTSYGPMEFQPNKPRAAVAALRGLSVAHIVVGILCVLFGLVAIILECNYSFVGWGLWSGLLFFVVTGILGVITPGRKYTRGVAIAFLAMSVVSAIVAFILMTTSIIFAAWESSYCNPSTFYFYSTCHFPPTTRLAIDASLAVLGLGEMVLGILTATLSCYGMCGCCRSYSPVMVQYMSQPDNEQAAPMTTMQQQQAASEVPSAV